ncbi:hypothetical protein AB0N24_26780 [Arthrobacter sp. NPDC093128]|uniref:hypothetical protein n=1 Tax=Arthrobacter sp. NPDC093128 TaxID=3154979 RepID=UPI0034464711
MKTRIPTAGTQAETLAVRSGDSCPETGWWQPLQSEDMSELPTSRFVGQGSPMPAVGSVPGLWVKGRNSLNQSDY